MRFSTCLVGGTIVFLIGAYAGATWYRHTPQAPVITRATARIYPTETNMVNGVVTFIQETTGVRVHVQCTGLTPGKHGFHIHELGDCTCTDGECAGAHFNPTNMPHGGLEGAYRHVGDFGNLEADSTGKAETTFLDKSIQLNGTHSIIGRSVIVHAQEDDLVSQPSGNAGARIGCGVIGIAQ